MFWAMTRASPTLRWTDEIIQASLDLAQVDAEALPAPVQRDLEGHLNHHLQQDLEEEFDRRYCATLDQTTQQLSYSELKQLERHTTEHLHRILLKEDEVIVRIACILRKTFFGIPSPVASAKPLTLPQELAHHVGAFLLGAGSSCKDLQHAIWVCQGLAYTGMEANLIRRVIGFVTARFQTLRRCSTFLTTTCAATVEKACHVLQTRCGFPNMHALYTAQACLDRVRTFDNIMADEPPPRTRGILLASACELAIPFNSMISLRGLSAEHVFRIMRSMTNLKFVEWLDGLLFLVIQLRDPANSPISAQNLVVLLQEHPEWVENSTYASELIDHLLSEDAPLAILEPLLQFWVRESPQCLGVTTFSLIASQTPYSPLFSATSMLRPDVVQRLLELGLSPYEVCIFNQRRTTPLQEAKRVQPTSEIHRMRLEATIQLFEQVPDLPVQHLERTAVCPLANLLVSFHREHSASAHAIFGLSAHSRGETDLPQRLVVLQKKLLDPRRSQYMLGVHARLTGDVISTLLDEAASLIRDGRGMESSQLPSLLGLRSTEPADWRFRDMP